MRRRRCRSRWSRGAWSGRSRPRDQGDDGLAARLRGDLGPAHPRACRGDLRQAHRGQRAGRAGAVPRRVLAPRRDDGRRRRASGDLRVPVLRGLRVGRLAGRGDARADWRSRARSCSPWCSAACLYTVVSRRNLGFGVDAAGVRAFAGPARRSNDPATPMSAAGWPSCSTPARCSTPSAPRSAAWRSAPRMLFTLYHDGLLAHRLRASPRTRARQPRRWPRSSSWRSLRSRVRDRRRAAARRVLLPGDDASSASW